MRDMHGREMTPRRVAHSRIAVTGADVAEVIIDSAGAGWARWWSAGPRSWSAWHSVVPQAEDIAIAGPYPALDGSVAALVSVTVWQPEPQSLTERAIGAAPAARTFYELTADGLSPADL
jgi:hypothetical protein